MPYPRRGQSTRRARPARASYLWENVIDATAFSVGVNSSVLTDMSPTLKGVPIDPIPALQVVRVVGNVLVKPSVLTNDNSVRVATGINVINRDAYAAGAGSVPRPDTTNIGWYWNKVQGWEYNQLQDSSASRDVGVAVKKVRSIAGMSNLLFFILRNISTGSIDVTVNLRVLFRLP